MEEFIFLEDTMLRFSGVISLASYNFYFPLKSGSESSKDFHKKSIVLEHTRSSRRYSANITLEG